MAFSLLRAAICGAALQVLRHIADSHRSSACAIVGVVMTDARWLDFQRRGFFPAVAQSRACFKRISASEALSGRGTCDIVLVKVHYHGTRP